MNKLYNACVCLFMFSTAAFAQVYVSPNSYVYVNDRMVFVKQDIDLQSNGNIYLRNEAQLLQGSTGSSANKGAGKLSVFQEGTVNNFAYNYWCSPVGEATVTPGNSRFNASMLHRPTNNVNSTQAVLLGSGSSNSVLNGTASPTFAIADRWIFKYVAQSAYSGWLSASGSTATIESGLGFTMKGSAGTDNIYTDAGQTNNPGGRQRYDFRGKPNDGNISNTVEPGKQTLIGNPYPSAIDLKAFLMAANNTTKIAYFWEQDPTTNSHLVASYKGGYGTYSPLATGGVTDPTHGYMGVYVPPNFYAYDGAGTQLAGAGTSGTAFQRRFSPIGQGFLVEGTASGNVVMSNNFRVYMKEGSYSNFNRNANNNANGFLPEIESVAGYDYTTVNTQEPPQIRFNTLLNNQGVKQTVLVMLDGASDGVELGMDAKSLDQAAVDMYFALDNSQYVVSVIDFDVNKKVPVGFKTNIPATFRMRVSEIINFEEAENIYLHDKQTDTYHDIKNADYEFNLPAGTVDTRYEITFVDALLGSNELSADAFGVFQNNDRQVLTVANPNQMNIKSVTLYDMGGKQIFNKTKLGTKENYEFQTSGISEAVYIVKIMTTDSQQFAKKVSVFRGR